MLVLLGGMSLFAQTAQTAQTPTGKLAGTVYDQAGARLEQAWVTLRNADTGVERTTSPNNRGEYHFDNVTLGKYSIRAAAKTLTTVQINDILIQNNKTVSVNVTLPEASTTPISVVEVSQAPEPADSEPVHAESTTAHVVTQPEQQQPNENPEDAKILNPKIVNGEINAIKERLALSAVQQEKIRAVLQDRQLQIAALRADTSLAAPIRRERVRVVRAAAEAKLRAVLTDDQQDEYDEILRERRERAAQRKQQETASLPQ